jgi:DNA-binding HxlR family transcriptional regulator
MPGQVREQRVERGPADVVEDHVDSVRAQPGACRRDVFPPVIDGRRERWTLLIVRDAFYGVRRFGDFAAQLSIPRAVLASPLKSLGQDGVLARDADAAGGVEYRLTAKGVALWPVMRAMMSWGDAFYSPAGTRRALRHEKDGASSTTTDAARTVACPSRSRKP